MNQAKNNINIPFPQRDIHIIQKSDPGVNLRFNQSEFGAGSNND